MRQFTDYEIAGELCEGVSDVDCMPDFNGLVQETRLFGRRQILNIIVLSAVKEGRAASGVQTIKRLVWLGVQLGLSIKLTAVLVKHRYMRSRVLRLIGGVSWWCA